MKRFACINGSRVIQIVEAETKPNWPPTQEGIKLLFIEIPEGITVETDFSYNRKTKVFTPYEGYGDEGGEAYDSDL